MADAITRYEKLLVVAPEPELVKKELSKKLTSCQLDNIIFHKCPTNDTWARDHGFITLGGDGTYTLLDFRFNGWGDKFEAALDNAINRSLYDNGVVEGTYTDLNSFVLDRKSTRLNSSHSGESRMPSSA